MIGNARRALLAGLIGAFVLAQTPVEASSAQRVPRSRAKEKQVIERVVVRLAKSSDKPIHEAIDDIQLLTPEEIAMLAANPQMMSVGGQTPEGADEAANLFLIYLAVAAGVGIIAVIAVAVAG